MCSASHLADVAVAAGSARRTSGTNALATSVSVTLVGRAAASIGSLTIVLLLHNGHRDRSPCYTSPCLAAFFPPRTARPWTPDPSAGRLSRVRPVAFFPLARWPADRFRAHDTVPNPHSVTPPQKPLSGL